MLNISEKNLFSSNDNHKNPHKIIKRKEYDYDKNGKKSKYIKN